MIISRYFGNTLMPHISNWGTPSQEGTLNYDGASAGKIRSQ